MNTQSFIEELVQQSSDLAKLLTEHLSDYEQLLPNVFLADVTRYVLANGRDRQRIVQTLEAAFDPTEPDIENLIAVSFVENIETPEQLARATEGTTTPRICAEWYRQRTP